MFRGITFREVCNRGNLEHRVRHRARATAQGPRCGRHGRIQSVGWGGGYWWGPQPNLPPNSDVSSDFGHFILKIWKIQNTKYKDIFIVKNFHLGDQTALSETLGDHGP